MMKTFSLFSRRKKKEENEYIDFLVGELENLKREMQETIEKKDDQIKKLTEELASQKLESDELRRQIMDKKQEKQAFVKNDQEMELLKTKLQEYQDSYDVFSTMIQKTKTECEKNIEESKKEAEQITDVAKTEAAEILLTAREDAKKIIDEYRMDYIIKRNKMKKCMDSLKGINKDMTGLYGKLGGFLRELSTVVENASENEFLELSEKMESEMFNEIDI